MSSKNSDSFNLIYPILFFFMVVLTFFVVAHEIQNTDNQKYMTIEVRQGDTLWEIAEKYENRHHYSRKAFIRWVEKVNGLHAPELRAGTELVIPVVKQEEGPERLAVSKRRNQH